MVYIRTKNSAIDEVLYCQNKLSTNIKLLVFESPVGGECIIVQYKPIILNYSMTRSLLG